MSSSAQPQPTPGSPASVLAAARTHQEMVRQGEAALMVDAVEWASMHEPVGDTPAASWWVHGVSIELAGEGAPSVTEDAVAEFAAAVGTVHLDADIDLGDALDLAKAVALTADQLKLAGSTDTLDGRRAAALGELARTQLAFTFGDDSGHPLPDGTGVTSTTTAPRPHRTDTRRPVTLFLHLSEDALGGDPSALGRCGNTRTPVSVDTVRAWCRNADVTLTPVIDITDHIRSDHYEVRGRLRAQIDQRDSGCVFPWCTRPARACDHDHVIADADGGRSCSCNIAPLCRHHHRLKTHYRWRLKMIEPGVVLWTSPHGYVFLRDHSGTTDVTPAGLVPIPGCPAAGGTDPPDQ